MSKKDKLEIEIFVNRELLFNFISESDAVACSLNKNCLSKIGLNNSVSAITSLLDKIKNNT